MGYSSARGCQRLQNLLVSAVLQGVHVMMDATLCRVLATMACQRGWPKRSWFGLDMRNQTMSGRHLIPDTCH